MLLFLFISLLLSLLILLLIYCYLEWKKGKVMSEDFEIDIEQEQGSTVIDSITLEDTLKLLKSDMLLPDLDNDLHKVHTGEKTITDHKEYFKTQVDSKLKKFCMIYHPDSVQRRGGSEEEVLKATAMQSKINAVRNILWHFNENFSQHDDFKYSYFSKVEVNLLSNEEKLEQVSYTVLHKLGELSHIKHEKLIPNLNQFLKSGQSSIKGFIAGNFNKFLKEKNNVEFYFREYLSAYKELFSRLRSFYELCKEDSYMKPIVAQMLNECSTQGKILIKINNSLSYSKLQRQVLINANSSMDCKYPYCINNQEDYQQADKYFTLPFIEYINILAISNEVYLTKNPHGRTLLASWILSLPIIHSLSKNSEVTFKADNEVIENSNDLISLHRLSHYLLTYYCYTNKKSGELATSFLRIDSLDEKYALQLLIQVIDKYSNYLENEFQPEKDFYERVVEVQMKFLKTMDSLYNEFYKRMDQHGEQFLKKGLELHRQTMEFHRQINEQASKRRRSESEFLVKLIERRKTTFAKIEGVTKVQRGIEEEQESKPSCSSPSQSHKEFMDAVIQDRKEFMERSEKDKESLKEFMERFEKGKGSLKESMERSEEEKESSKEFIERMDENSEKTEERYRELINKIDQEKEELVKETSKEKQELVEAMAIERNELIERIDEEKNKNKLVNQELLTKMNTIPCLYGVNAVTQELAGSGKSNHIQSSNENESNKIMSKLQCDNSSADIKVIENPSTDIDKVRLSSSLHGMGK
jgi:hypothetical protein